MDPRKGVVECGEHGTQSATFVCCHIVEGLITGTRPGFFQAFDLGNPRPDAWCAKCESRVQAAGGDWTDEAEAFADVTLLCAACYDRAKALSEAPP